MSISPENLLLVYEVPAALIAVHAEHKQEDLRRVPCNSLFVRKEMHS